MTTQTAQNWIETTTLTLIEDAYNLYTRRGGSEPVMTASLIAGDISANYHVASYDYQVGTLLREEVQKALVRLTAAGKLTTSWALKGNRQVRAYELV